MQSQVDGKTSGSVDKWARCRLCVAALMEVFGPFDRRTRAFPARKEKMPRCPPPPCCRKSREQHYSRRDVARTHTKGRHTHSARLPHSVARQARQGGRACRPSKLHPGPPASQAAAHTHTLAQAVVEAEGGRGWRTGGGRSRSSRWRGWRCARCQVMQGRLQHVGACGFGGWGAVCRVCSTHTCEAAGWRESMIHTHPVLCPEAQPPSSALAPRAACRADTPVDLTAAPKVDNGVASGHATTTDPTFLDRWVEVCD